MKTFIITATLCLFILLGGVIFAIADLLITGLIWFAWWLAAMAVLAPAYIGILAWRRQTHNHMRPSDGSFAMQKHWHDPAPKRLLKTLRGQQPEFTVWNPNNDPGYAARFNGKIESVEPAAGWFHQLDYAKLSKQHAIAQAAFPGDAAISSKNGSMYRPGGNGAARQLLGKLDQRPAGKIIDVAPTPALPMLPQPMPISLSEALETSRPDAWILGTNKRDANQLAIFNPVASVHAGIIGATGTGKTSGTGMLMALHAAKNHYHLVILDPKGGTDWSPFAPVSEYHQTDAGIFKNQIKAVVEEHQRRHALLKQAQVPTVDHLSTQNRPAPIMVLIEEYGLLRHEMGGGGDVDAVDDILYTLLTQARMTRIHLLLIDQYFEHWAKPVFTNTKTKLVYRVDRSTAAQVEEYEATSVALAGEFVWNRQKYAAWHTAGLLHRLIESVPQNRYPQLIDGTTAPLASSVPVPSVVPPRNNVVPLGGSVTVWGDRTPVDLPPPGTSSAAEQSYSEAELQRMVWSLRDQNSELTQTEIRTTLAARGVEISKTHTHRCWHSWPGNQPASAAEQLAAQGIDWSAVRLPGGDKLGVDISYNGASA